MVLRAVGHQRSRHAKIFLRVREDDEAITFRLASN
jgi:hypothetical protein